MYLCPHTPTHLPARHKLCLGMIGEEAAERVLRSCGCEILDRNWRTRDGELDLVIRDGHTVAAVEVKTRTSDIHGSPFHAITEQKIGRLRKTFGHWLDTHDEYAHCIRIDAIAVTIEPNGDAEISILRGIE